MEETGLQPIARRDFLKFAGIFGGAALALNGNLWAEAARGKKKTAKAKAVSKPKKAEPAVSQMAETLLAYDETGVIVAKTFDNLMTVEGISQNQLNQHIGLYQGYVNKINDITSQLATMSPDQSLMNGTYNSFRELHVEQSFALNGVVLHEHYFENIGGDKAQPSENFKNLMRKEFGNWDNYLNQLTAAAKSARGWVMTAYNMRDHRVHNYLLDSHNQLVPFYVMPILVLDVYEHAYMVDFGTKRAPYVEAFMENINWAVVEQRLENMLWHANKKK